ncbi:hypothetical protein CR513_42773, partial [Mucuna pruriens]
MEFTQLFIRPDKTYHGKSLDKVEESKECTLGQALRHVVFSLVCTVLKIGVLGDKKTGSHKRTRRNEDISLQTSSNNVGDEDTMQRLLRAIIVLEEKIEEQACLSQEASQHKEEAEEHHREALRIAVEHKEELRRQLEVTMVGQIIIPKHHHFPLSRDNPLALRLTKLSSYHTSAGWQWTLLMEPRTPTFTSKLSKPRSTLAVRAIPSVTSFSLAP